MKDVSDKAKDLALEVRRGQRKMADVPDKLKADVTYALGRAGVLAPHARKRERESNPLPSRFQKPNAERARFA